MTEFNFSTTRRLPNVSCDGFCAARFRNAARRSAQKNCDKADAYYAEDPVGSARDSFDKILHLAVIFSFRIEFVFIPRCGF